MKLKREQLFCTVVALTLVIGVPPAAWAFNSGSTGADGAFNPTASTQLQLPPDGIFNFTTVNIPAGVTVTFKKNTTNTPVVILASGNVTIAGTLDVSGGNAAHVGTAHDGKIADDGLPGAGGPGGFDGGKGGAVGNGRGSYGFGPGGGPGGNGNDNYYGWPCGGSGGGYGSAGEMGNVRYDWGERRGNCDGGSATTYGSTLIIPLIGGSGGGGGRGGSSLAGSGGGGGGGAVLIASSATVNITGAVLANGGIAGHMLGSGCGTSGGGGSGGAIRIIATTLSGNGNINANPGGFGMLCTGKFFSSDGVNPGGSGGFGRVRLETETLTRTTATSPVSTVTLPGAVFVPGLPTLRFVRVAGMDAPASPTGKSDIVLPKGTTNPVTVEFAATGVPVGNKITLTLKADGSALTQVTSTALSGTTQSSAATASVSLPPGPSVLQATVTYTVVASVGDLLGTQFARGERVETVTITAGLTGSSMVTLTTVSGKEYTVPSHMAAGFLGG